MMPWKKPWPDGATLQPSATRFITATTNLPRKPTRYSHILINGQTVLLAPLNYPQHVGCVFCTRTAGVITSVDIASPANTTSSSIWRHIRSAFAQYFVFDQSRGKAVLGTDESDRAGSTVRDMSCSFRYQYICYANRTIFSNLWGIPEPELFLKLATNRLN